MSSIPILVESSNEPESGTLGLLSGGREIKEISVEKLKESVSNLSGQISEVFSNIKKVGDFNLKQVQLSVSINAQGSFTLIGSVSAGIKGAVTLTFSA